ncbi:ComEC/Rec2 family competence protein, partial [Candidatus Babeliales bacterium]|nr:ComEC/Rec2 family competence protein [Candidatus Babeliales bacterium]
MLKLLKTNFQSLPLLPAVIGTITGIIWQSATCGHWIFLISGLSMTIFIALHILRQQHLAQYTANKLNITFIFFFLAALSLQLNTARIEKMQLLAKHAIVIEGTIIETTETQGYLNQKLTLQIERITTQKNHVQPWRKYKLVVFCRCHWLKPGDDIKISAPEISPPPKQSPFKCSNSWNNYLSKENILGYVFCKNSRTIKRLRNTPQSISLEKKNSIDTSMQYKLSPTTYDLFASIFLGKKTITVGSQLREYFSYWGLSHYLARSGLHVVLFTSIWVVLLSIVTIPIAFRYFIIALFVLAYGALSWTSISFLRAHWVFLLFALGRATTRPTRAPHLLTIVALILLLYSPFQLFALDFQLSFVLAFALSILSPMLLKNNILKN